MVNIVIKAVVVLYLTCVPTLSLDQHFLCKNVQSVFAEDHTVVSAHSRRIQGPPGKRGPLGGKGERGLPGPRGLPGSPAVVNYQSISAPIEAKLHQKMEEVFSEIAKLRENFTKLQADVAPSLKMLHVQRCKDEGGLPYGGMCYMPDFSTSSYSDAGRKCTQKQSFMAEIHTRSQQMILQRFLHEKGPNGQGQSGNSFYMWVGMMYDSSRQILRFRSGKEVSKDQFQWHDGGYPSGSGVKIRMEIIYNGHSNEGLLNFDGSASYGVICEKTL